MEEKVLDDRVRMTSPLARSTPNEARALPRDPASAQDYATVRGQEAKADDRARALRLRTRRLRPPRRGRPGRELAGTGLTENQWVILTLAVAGGAALA